MYNLCACVLSLHRLVQIHIFHLSCAARLFHTYCWTISDLYAHKFQMIKEASIVDRREKHRNHTADTQ